jgi:hypothetical protein
MAGTEVLTECEALYQRCLETDTDDMPSWARRLVLEMRTLGRVPPHSRNRVATMFRMVADG